MHLRMPSSKATSSSFVTAPLLKQRPELAATFKQGSVEGLAYHRGRMVRTARGVTHNTGCSTTRDAPAGHRCQAGAETGEIVCMLLQSSWRITVEEDPHQEPVAEGLGVIGKQLATD